jgi:ubiquinone/menaquinone biosynthesis C-methylase UbiE
MFALYPKGSIMKKSIKPEFDQYAGKYTDLHQASIQASGEDPAYFAAYKAKYMAAWIGQHAKTQPLSILDFGCGIGNTISHLRQAFPEAGLHGADLSGESVRLATESHAHEATFRTIENSRIPYEDKSFDVVMAACVFHHIPPDERTYWMTEIRRVLKPGAHAFIFEHNVLNPLTMKTVRECPFDEDAILLPRAELLGLARHGKFEEVRSHYIVFFPRMLSLLRPLEPAMGWIPFGAQYVVHAVAV